LKQQHLLFRVLGNQPQAIAQDVCEFIQGFPGLRDKGVKLFVKTAVDPEDNTLAYDVFMETDSGEDINLAHEAELEYFQVRELHRKVLGRYAALTGDAG
jgi:hypothetical protein